MSIRKQELGKHLYLYRQPYPTNSVGISSHGGYQPSTRTFDLRTFDNDGGAQGSLQGITVYFFKKHGFASPYKILQGLGSDDYANFEEYKISDAQGEKGKSIIVNYELSKFEDDTDKEIFEKMGLIEKDKRPGVPIRDLITIRNRKGAFQKVITLEKVVRKAVPLGYRRFFCIFCRSQMEKDAIQLQAFKWNEELNKNVQDLDYKTWERTRIPTR